ncbi:lipid-A-disaccharide synthase [Microcoleus sp. FACHB-SPT15]|uniref:lipid-A-disaccharide synthase n=1 Tax=Microcoleus sp. FACHB-SPT15 TaxID=2692830 RepID=UPI0017823026|nr:lipid-A-disaccharide synthase [Microcoleus sp. FACHB-SPT15]MBD1808474.1 lipid-A-disaccharide synthase [Microcoleus sp. FACHB-SPT15]
MQSTDILILSNGPGEVTTWVRPVVKALRQQLGDNRAVVRISVVLSPCPNATGKEAAIAKSYPEVDRVQGAEHFFRFLLWGKTAENWDWHEKGVVVFLGGDQFFPVVIGKRLGYRTVVYAEWDARWHGWIDRFGVMQPKIIAQAPKKYADKLTVVGDLMVDVGIGNGKVGIRNWEDLGSTLASSVTNSQSSIELIGLLPGSKPAKLTQGVPLTLTLAQYIYSCRPQTRFVIPVAPTLDLSTLARFADPQQNPLIRQLGWGEAELVIPSGDTSNRPFLKTPTGLCVELRQEYPAHDLLSQCRLCLTTVGANTAELGSLGVPMIVLLPMQQLDAMRSWDGLPGILARMPGVGSGFAKIINSIVIRQGRLFAWPNKWAQAEIVPELVGKLEPHSVAQLALDYLENPQKLEEMRSQLRAVRGQPGAAHKLAQLVLEELNLV